MLGNIGFSELMILMVVVLLVFGAKRLPEIGSSIGKGIREFKRSISDAGDSITASVTSSPRCAGRQCMKSALPPLAAINVSLTW